MPVEFSSAWVSTSRSRHSGGDSSVQCTRPETKSSRPYPTICRQQIVGNSADRLLLCPSVQLLGSTIPVPNSSIHFADEDAVMCEIQEVRLLLQGRFGLLLGALTRNANGICVP